MKILVDADGCPVVKEAVACAKSTNTEILLLCDTSHEIEYAGIQTITVAKGADSVDYALVNLIKKGDIVVTQDYGLAAMSLVRGGRCVNQDGMEYTNENIDALLLFRHTSRKVRQSGGRLKGPHKRKKEQQNKRFYEVLLSMISKSREEQTEI